MTDPQFIATSRGVPVAAFDDEAGAVDFVQAHRVHGDAWRVDRFEDGLRTDTVDVWTEDDPDLCGVGKNDDD